MRTVQVVGPHQNDWVEVPVPHVGPNDVLLKIRACGICGSDAYYTSVGGIPPRQGATPLGHEPAGEIVRIGANVTGFTIGDHVVPDPMAAPTGIIGSGGATGALADYLLIHNAEEGVTLRTIPDHIPWDVAALNEPMAVAHHAVNRSGAKPGDTAVVFGAGPIGLGATISLKAKGVAHVVVIDVVPARLHTALKIGADAVINSTEQDIATRLNELHGAATDALGHTKKVGTDIYIDAAGAAPVLHTIFDIAKHRAIVTVVAVHKHPIDIDLGKLLSTEIDLRLSMGYPTEIFEVTDQIITHWEKYQHIISHRMPFNEALDALTLASMPGIADKVIVTFDDTAKG